jgi:hypothetical protein
LYADDTLKGALPVLQTLDINGDVVWELYLDAGRGLHLWSPPGRVSPARRPFFMTFHNRSSRRG